MTEDRERIARLEANLDATNKLLEEVRTDIRKLLRARGVVTGVVLAISGLWGLALGIWQFVRHKIGG